MGSRTPFSNYITERPSERSKSQWILSRNGAVGNEIADCLTNKETKISQTSACKVTSLSARLRIKGVTYADLLEYYAIQSHHKSWNKIVKNRNIIPDFLVGDALETFCLITGHD
jgi:hypothetical protein